MLLILEMTEVDAHERAVGHLFQNGSVGAEGVGREHVPVACGAVMIGIDGGFIFRDDDNLGEGESHALAQLVAAVEDKGEPFAAAVLVKGIVVLVNRAGIPAPCDGVELSGIAAKLRIVEEGAGLVPAQDELFGIGRLDEEAQRRRGGVARGGAHLLVDPGGVAAEGVVAVCGDEGAHLLNRGGGGAIGGLHQESGDVAIEFRVVCGAPESEIGKFGAPVDRR